MTEQTFFQRHYSPRAGESPLGHALAVLAGITLMAIGAALAFSLVLLPIGSVVGLIGAMLFGAGVFAHIQSPLKLRDLMDAIITLTGAAIAGTFALAILAAAIGLLITALLAFLQWLGW